MQPGIRQMSTVNSPGLTDIVFIKIFFNLSQKLQENGEKFSIKVIAKKAEMFWQKTTNSCCFIVQMALVNYSITMIPESLDKLPLASWKISCFCFFAMFWELKVFSSRKNTAWSTRPLGDYLISERRSLGHWLNGKSLTHFINTVGRLPIFKFIWRKRPYWRKIFVIFPEKVLTFLYAHLYLEIVSILLVSQNIEALEEKTFWRCHRKTAQKQKKTRKHNVKTKVKAC